MESYDSNPRKTVGKDSGVAKKNDEPARITVEDADGAKAYDVEHHVRSEREGWVSMYLTRDGSGIDLQVPREHVIKIERGREHHAAESTASKELAADGGNVKTAAVEFAEGRTLTVEVGEVVHDRETVGRRGRDDRRTVPVWARVEYEDGDTVKLAVLGADGDGARNYERWDVLSVEDLSRCAKCGELKTYAEAVCDECKGENDGE